MFSLTENIKFSLKNQSSALYRRSDKTYVVFENFFYIGGNANTKDTSCLGLDSINYDSLNYKDNKESYLKMNGNETKKFTVKEW